MYICVCAWVTLLYSRKLTEDCKPALMGKKNHLEKREREMERKESVLGCEALGPEVSDIW